MKPVIKLTETGTGRILWIFMAHIEAMYWDLRAYSTILVVIPSKSGECYRVRETPEEILARMGVEL